MRCSLPTAGCHAALNLCLASGRPVAGVKADAGLEWLPMASRQGSERSGNQSRTAQLAASFDRCREAHAATPWDLADLAVLLLLLLLRTPETSLTQERLERSPLDRKGRPVWIILFL